MIPDIGFMIGCYIVTRMISLMKNDKSIGIRIIAVITIIVTAYCMTDLLVHGLTPAPVMPSF